MVVLGLPPLGSVGMAVWRRDVVVEQGGFSGIPFGEYLNLWLRWKRVSLGTGMLRVLLLSENLARW